MVKHIRIVLVSLLAVAMLLSASPVVHADGGDNADAVIDISIKGDPKVDILARGTCEVNIKREASSEANTVAMFLSPDSADNGNGAIIDISISGESEVDILAKGTCEVNLRVEGPSEVYIDAGDEVRLNVEASDESQVFLDDQSLDNPSQKPDEPAGYQESVMPVISGIFPAAGLLAFFLIRRRAKNKVNNEGR